jgi:uncharacterized membrane protein|tara:strand:- start:568 stop:810 length:243 start_codon:yes stop_codon:yes gene_type:complete
MNTQVNFSHLIAVIIGILIPTVIWGVSVETRFEKVYSNSEDIVTLKEDLKELSKNNQINFDKVLVKLHDIDLSLKDKKDR